MRSAPSGTSEKNAYPLDWTTKRGGLPLGAVTLCENPATPGWSSTANPRSFSGFQELSKVGNRNGGDDRRGFARAEILGQRHGETETAAAVQAPEHGSGLDLSERIECGLDHRLVLRNRRFNQVLEVIGQLRNRFGRDDNRLCIRRPKRAHETEHTNQQDTESPRSKGHPHHPFFTRGESQVSDS